ncbi:MAG: hypothetical protein ACKOXJ_01995, partial [Alphaproteobacteria bacterium]
DMRRKFLESVSCNDGNLDVKWNFDDPHPDRACNGEGGFSGCACAHINQYYEEGQPAEKYLDSVGGWDSELPITTHNITSDLPCQ